MSEYLEQTRKYTRGQYKYSLDCDKIKSNPDSLQILNGSVRAKHTIIMNASDVLVTDNVPTKYVYNPNIFGGKVKRTKRNKRL